MRYKFIQLVILFFTFQSPVFAYQIFLNPYVKNSSGREAFEYLNPFRDSLLNYNAPPFQFAEGSLFRADKKLKKVGVGLEVLFNQVILSLEYDSTIKAQKSGRGDDVYYYGAGIPAARQQVDIWEGRFVDSITRRSIPYRMYNEHFGGPNYLVENRYAADVKYFFNGGLSDVYAGITFNLTSSSYTVKDVYTNYVSRYLNKYAHDSLFYIPGKVIEFRSEVFQYGLLLGYLYRIEGNSDIDFGIKISNGWQSASYQNYYRTLKMTTYAEGYGLGLYLGYIFKLENLDSIELLFESERFFSKGIDATVIGGENNYTMTEYQLSSIFYSHEFYHGIRSFDIKVAYKFGI